MQCVVIILVCLIRESRCKNLLFWFLNINFEFMKTKKNKVIPVKKPKKDYEKLFNDIIKDITENKTPVNQAIKKTMYFDKFYQLLDSDVLKKERYARAREIRADVIFQEIIEISDDSSQDELDTEFGVKENKEFVNRSRLKIEARKWVLSKMNPKKYGEKIDITTDNESLNKPIFNIQIDGKDIDLK